MKHAPIVKSILLSLMACLCLAGCADNLSGDVYSRDEARKTMDVSYGTVMAVRPVVIEGDRGFLGQAGGAVIGGMAGNTMGGGGGKDLATAVGAVAGAVAGGVVQEKSTRAQGAEITVRLDSNGSSIAVVQQVEDLNEFVAGQRVRMTASNGTTRVAALGNYSSGR
jgi:outer membrane lipoprotein SlyB